MDLEIDVHCKSCDVRLATSDMFAFYFQNEQSCHFVVKHEKRNKALEFLKFVASEDGKSKKFLPFIVQCFSCGHKLGSDALVGPKNENTVTFKMDQLYFVRSRSSAAKIYLDCRLKWKQIAPQYGEFETRKFDSFYGPARCEPSLASTPRRTNFIDTKLPTERDVYEFNITNLIEDAPRTYQVELYLSALFSNSIVYLPTGSGKTMVAAMVIAYMKKLNPQKKVFFVCDRVPLVYQQASYLRAQCTRLSVGEFCGESKTITKSQMKSDVFVLTCGFLLNMLENGTLYMQDCCCLVIDEIHHAVEGHVFKRLIEKYWQVVETPFKSRLLGLTASPGSKSSNNMDIVSNIGKLCELINGHIFMPIFYESDFKKIIIRPNMEFLQVEPDVNEQRLVDEMNKCVPYFLNRLNYKSPGGQRAFNVKDNHIRGFIRNTLKSYQMYKHPKEFTVASFLSGVLNSMEVMKILGVTSAVNHLAETIREEMHKTNAFWSTQDLNEMNRFQQSIAGLTGVSPRILKLVSLLKDDAKYANEQSRVIVFVRTRKTVRYLLNYLNADVEVRRKWHPSDMVGHGGGSADGMTWEDDQEPRIDKFHEGQVRLFVSTNVLQEGLDVHVCDQVIMFDPVYNLTEYIQSRGRARHVNSQYLLICTSDQKRNYLNLIEFEHSLNEIIRRQMMNYSARLSNDLLAHQVKLVEQTDRRPRAVETFEKSSSLSSSKKVKFYLQIYLMQKKQTEELNGCLNACKGFQQAELAKDAYLAECLFGRECSAFSSSFEIKNTASSAHKSVYQTIRFILGEFQRQCCVEYFKPNKHSAETLPDAQFVTQSVQFGNLANLFEFYTSTRHPADSKLLLNHSSNTLLVLLFIREQLYKLEIDFDAIDSIICVDLNDDQTDSFRVYVPLSRCPLVYSLGDEEKVDAQNLDKIDEEHLAWNRCVLPDGLDYSVRFEFKNEHQSLLIDHLHGIKNCHVLFSRICETTASYTIANLRRDFRPVDFDSSYALECFISQFDYMLTGKLNVELAARLNSLDAKTINRHLQTLAARLASNRYLSLTDLFEKVVDELKNDRHELDLIDSNANLKVNFIRRVTMTPTRMIFYFPEANFSNRVTRNFGAEKFLRVRFRDENEKHKLNTSANYCEMSAIYGRISELLRNGVELCGRKYDFLAMSASQLREHGCWFYLRTGAGDNARLVRQWMGDFSNIRCVGKYAARLGQSLSGSIETFTTQHFVLIDDVETPDGYCFTDGIGKISSHKAKELTAKYYQIDRYALSAFQIRFGGYKGVVAVDPHLTHHELQFRRSMKKFDSGYNRLDVLNATQYIPCYLNRQVIVILSSLNIADEVFDRLQDEMLGTMSEMLVDSHQAETQISKYYRCVFNFCSPTKTSTRLDYAFEPFFRDLLKSMYMKTLQDLIQKSRIFIRKGRILMGTIDEWGVLEPDQVFIQCSCVESEGRDDDQVKYVENDRFVVENRRVVVTKNPCMHPGDVRILNAVDSPRLRHMFDCVVFPCKGPRPITNMCSGSDLDGDLYFVCWEPSLVPEKEHEPMIYKSPSSKEKSTDVEIDDVAEFFVDFIKMDNLGRIANAHVALADQSKHGVRDGACIKLAKLFSLAVDFPKHGVCVDLPDEVKVTKYPDFMGKSDLISYESNKVIGHMYRKVKSLLCDDEYLTRNSAIDVNPSFLIDGYEEYMDEATALYVKYRSEMRKIMAHFKCNCESELFVGFYMSSSHSDEAKNFFQLSSMMVKNLWLHMRREFLNNNTSEQQPSEIKRIRGKKASAWYYACYSSEENKQLRIISFPWIVEDYLYRFVESIKNYDFFSKSLIDKFLDVKDEQQMLSRFAQTLELQRDLSCIMKSPLILCGAFGLFLFENNTELNFFLLGPSRRICDEDVHELENFYDYVLLDKPDKSASLTCNHADDVKFSIYECDELTVLRFMYIRKIILQNPIMLPVLYAILHFARLDNLFLVLNADRIKFDMYLEYCIGYLIEKGLVENRVNPDEIRADYANLLSQTRPTMDSFDEWIDVLDFLDQLQLQEQCNGGRMLLYFYKDHAYFTHKNEIRFRSEFDCATSELELGQISVEKLKSHCYKAFTLLTKSTNISDVWTLIGQKGEPPSWSNRRGLKVCHRRRKGAAPTNLFCENANLFLFSNLQTIYDRIHFELYNGARRSAHLNKQCFSAKIERPVLAEFSQQCFQEFYVHSMTQFNKAKETNTDFNFKISIKFGNVYFSNVPSMLLEESNSVSLDQLRDSLRKGYSKFNFNCLFDRITLIQPEKNINDEQCLSADEAPNEVYDDENIEDDETTNYDKEKRQKIETATKKRKKKKNPIAQAKSAFDSNVISYENIENKLLVDCEFESKISESYLVYLDLIGASKQAVRTLKIKYDLNMNLFKVDTHPLTWLSIDMRNSSSFNTDRDVRFSLRSEKPIDVDKWQCRLANGANLNEVVKRGVFIKDVNSGEFRLSNEIRTCATAYLRHSHGTKFYGKRDNWSHIFKLARIDMPQGVPAKLYESFRVCVSESDEYTDNQLHDGVFKTKLNRKEVFILAKVNLNELKPREIHHLIILAWNLAQAFLRI